MAYRGPGVARGFFEDPEADAEAFKDGFFFPGDLGVVDASGFVSLRGRRKDMIIRGGINIYPAEIESILLDHETVAEAAVVGWPSRDLGEEVAAFVMPRGKADPEALRALCAARLAPYKVPRAMIVTDELPRNSSGKVLKAELVARLQPL
jgi:acyl-CoA synthetase (AMP-forming)/AMP-acid ligase II